MPPSTPGRFTLDPTTLPPDAAYVQPADGSEPPRSIAGNLVRSVNPQADLSSATLPPDAAYIQPVDGSTPPVNISPEGLPLGSIQDQEKVGSYLGDEALGFTKEAGKHALNLAFPHTHGGYAPESYLMRMGYDPTTAAESDEAYRRSFEPSSVPQALGAGTESLVEAGVMPEGEEGFIEDMGERVPKLISKMAYSGVEGTGQAAEEGSDPTDLSTSAALEAANKAPGLHQLVTAKQLYDAGRLFNTAASNPDPEAVHAAFEPVTGLMEGVVLAALGKEALVHELGEHMAEEHEAHGGATYDPRTGESMRGKNLWATDVAPELRQTLDHAPTAEDISHFVDSHLDLFHQNKNAYVGSHVDPQTGQHHLEIVGLTPSKNDAAAISQQTGNNTIFHLGHEQYADAGTPEPDAPALQVPVETRLAAMRSNEPVKANYVGVHYSDNKFDLADGARRTGSGAEGERLNLGTQLGYGQDAPGGVYVYDKGARAEAPLADKKHAYEIRGKYALANIADNPAWQAGLAKGKADAVAHGADDRTATLLGINAAEHALQDAGFDGYYNPQQPHIKFLFGNHPASPLGTTASGAGAGTTSKPSWKTASPDEADQVTYHGQTVQASPKQIERALGKPTIEYADPEKGGKSRTEWDLKDANGDIISVFDHHHYGPTPKNQPIEFSIESNRGPADVHKGPTGEFIAPQTPTDIEKAVAGQINAAPKSRFQAVEQKFRRHEGDPFGLNGKAR